MDIIIIGNQGEGKTRTAQAIAKKYRKESKDAFIFDEVTDLKKALESANAQRRAIGYNFTGIFCIQGDAKEILK